MNELVKSNGIKYGGIFAIIAIVYSYAAYIINEDLFTNWWISILLMLSGLVMFVVAVVKTKKDMGGFISFKDAFSAFMVASILYLAAATLANMVLFQIVDTDLGPRLQEKMIEMTYERFESFGMSEEQINEAVIKMEEQDSFSLKGQITGLFSGILFFAVIGLVVALILKKKKPEWEAIDNTDENE